MLPCSPPASYPCKHAHLGCQDTGAAIRTLCTWFCRLSSLGAHDNAQQKQLCYRLDHKVDSIPFIGHDSMQQTLAGGMQHCRKCTW